MTLLPPSIAFLMGGFALAGEASKSTLLELSTDQSTRPMAGPGVTVSPDTKTLQFSINPRSQRVQIGRAHV